MTDGDLTFPDGPRVELDRRLADLVDAANEVLVTQGRLRALLRANRVITSQLDLDGVQRSIVEAAQQLTGARCAALGVVDEHGAHERFVHIGMQDEDLRRIERLTGESLGAADIDPAKDPGHDGAAGPRPPGSAGEHQHGHDPLAVPVPVRGELYGTLYLVGAPRAAFTAEDEQLVGALAATAGFAVENARLYGETQRRQQWAAASAEVTELLLAPGAGDVLPLVAARVQELAAARSTFVVMVADGSDEVTVIDVVGADPDAAHGTTRPLAGTIAETAVRTGRPQRYDEQEIRVREQPQLAPFGPVLALPLAASERTIGALVVARQPGDPSFTEAELVVAADFAGRAAVALELTRARAQADRMLLFEERERIARDLHDRVIQQLFATGMQLQGVLGTMQPGREADRVDTAIASLDDSIAQIRRIVFTLQAAGGSPDRATGRQRLFDLVHRRSVALGVEPAVAVTGPVDAVLEGELADDVLDAVGEGLSNAVKHGSAADIAVAVRADGRGVTVTVSNEGAPGAASGRRSGLGNLEERAARRGGTMTLAERDGRTVLEWAVPLQPESRIRAAQPGARR